MDQDDPYDGRIVKEELTITSEYENDNETIPCQVEDDDNNFAFRGLHETSIKRPLKKIAYGKMKRDLARIIKNFPCLWDGDNEFYGNREKRSEAWCRIGQLLHLNVFEVKALWKKLKDTHRYLSAKFNKSQNKFDPNDFCDDNDDVMENLSFLNQRKCNSRKRRASKNVMKLRMKNALPDPLEVEESSFSENPESSSLSIDAAQSLEAKTEIVQSNETTTVTKMATTAQITSLDSEKIAGENSGNNTLKHIHIWTQLEKLFEKLDEDKITDLNFVFISETYKAILEKRKTQLN